MQVDLNTIKDKNDYYELAQEYLKKIDFIELDINEIIPKSISILIDHDFILTPCIKIKINLFQDQKEVGVYYLYVNNDKEFIDEFLIIK